jgi:hypothetical protein
MRTANYLLAPVALGGLMLLPQPTLASPLTAGLTGAGPVATDAGLVENVEYYDRRYDDHYRYYYGHRYAYRRYHRLHYYAYSPYYYGYSPDYYGYSPDYCDGAYGGYYGDCGYPYGYGYGFPFLSFGLGFGGWGGHHGHHHHHHHHH